MVQWQWACALNWRVGSVGSLVPLLVPLWPMHSHPHHAMGWRLYLLRQHVADWSPSSAVAADYIVSSWWLHWSSVRCPVRLTRPPATTVPPKQRVVRRTTAVLVKSVLLHALSQKKQAKVYRSMHSPFAQFSWAGITMILASSIDLRRYPFMHGPASMHQASIHG
jgi:hypothetical protein